MILFLLKLYLLLGLDHPQVASIGCAASTATYIPGWRYTSNRTKMLVAGTIYRTDGSGRVIGERTSKGQF